MIEQGTQTTASVTPLDFIDMPYSPALLLEGRFDASITDHVDFAVACREGFECCLEEIDDFCGLFASWDGMEREIVRTMTRCYDKTEQYWGVCSLPDRAGFMLGVLSAYAYVDRLLVLCGLGLLTKLVPSCQKEEPEWFKKVEGVFSRQAVSRDTSYKHDGVSMAVANRGGVKDA
jgi:hypothetical protein